MTLKSSKRAPQGATPNTTATNDTHLIGYARVSSGSQDTTVQEAMLRAGGCTLVRTEKVSGRSREGRSELEALMDFIRPGDSLVVAKLDSWADLGNNVRVSFEEALDG
jgi:DNA invertase Pin-like site-specific DNA recombinase